MNIDLNEKQRQAYELVLQGCNVFITGPSGTGKSTIIKYIDRQLSRIKRVAITSTTGVSATLLGGTTLHSYLGIGLGTSTTEILAAKITNTTYLRNRWRKLDILVIDEISMLSPELFDKLENVARIVRYSEHPFGGIQLVLFGDFLQLPVVKNDKFCFESEAWKCITRTVYLTEIIRQADKEFQNVLNDIRYGKCSRKSREILSSRIGYELSNDLGIKPTVIYTTNASVDELNEKELDALNENNLEFIEYKMTFSFYQEVKTKATVIEKYRKNMLVPETIQLCVGAQVMLLVNLDVMNNLANGSRGVVIGFENDFPIVRFLDGQERHILNHEWDFEEDGKKLLRVTQIPLKLAWAITVHKSQGSTLDYAKVDLSNVFEYGQAYVALSRVKTKEGLSIIDINFKDIKAHPKALKFYENLQPD